MKTTNFAKYLSKFFNVYLPGEKGCSPRTIDTYRYAFISFIDFIEQTYGIKPSCITMEHFTKENVQAYIKWLETEKNNSISTRNARLAAIKSFANYIVYEFPEYLYEEQKILSIPMKKAPQREISYLKTDGVKLLISQIDKQTLNGFRDYVIIMLFYTTGMRVSELINIKVKDVMLEKPSAIRIHGKGNKGRYTILVETAVELLKKYMTMMHYDDESKLNEYLFLNHSKQQFTRQGIDYMIRKYAVKAAAIDQSLIPDDLSAHKLRHTAAMALQEQGVDLVYIRDLLGHSSVKTTEIYAKTDAKRKREAIENASIRITESEEASWEDNADLRDWLKSFNKSK